MTYASASRKPNPAAVAGALGIPGAFGALLAVGLAVTVVTAPDRPNPRAEPIATTPLPPPPPPAPEPQQRDRVTQPAATRPAPVPLPPPGPLPVDPGLGAPVGTGPGTGADTGTRTDDFAVPAPVPSASPFDPVGAVPRGNPSRWVTDDDYRPRWIREDMAGRASFALSIDAGGKVTGCTITRSTGHAPLDAATCDLVKRRARFDAARDASGRAVAGSYRGSITWRIPE
jgi:protein TonB